MASLKRVLLVDDDSDVRQLYRQALALEGYEVKEARGGFEALRHLDSYQPDVVVLDLVMPDMDGYTVRNELAAQAHTRDIPVVIVTGVTELPSSLDVACVLRKPVPPDAVVAAVRKCIASGAVGG